MLKDWEVVAKEIEKEIQRISFNPPNALNLFIIAQEELFGLTRLKIWAKHHLSISAEFLGYCDLRKLWKLTQDLLSWVHHFFPWNIGVLFPQRTPEEIAEMSKLVSLGVEIQIAVMSAQLLLATQRHQLISNNQRYESVFGYSLEADTIEVVSLRLVITGPAIIGQMDTTTIIPPSDIAEVDRFGNIIIERKEK